MGRFQFHSFGFTCSNLVVVLSIESHSNESKYFTSIHHILVDTWTHTHTHNRNASKWQQSPWNLRNPFHFAFIAEVTRRSNAFSRLLVRLSWNSISRCVRTSLPWVSAPRNESYYNRRSTVMLVCRHVNDFIVASFQPYQCTCTCGLFFMHECLLRMYGEVFLLSLSDEYAQHYCVGRNHLLNARKWERTLIAYRHYTRVALARLGVLELFTTQFTIKAIGIARIVPYAWISV